MWCHLQTSSNRSCSKVLFSQASVILSTGERWQRGDVCGEGVCVAKGDMACKANRGHVWLGGHVWQGTCMAGGMPGRGCAWEGGMCGRGEGMHGRRDGPCRGRNASYGNAFLFVKVPLCVIEVLWTQKKKLQRYLSESIPFMMGGDTLCFLI